MLGGPSSPAPAGPAPSSSSEDPELVDLPEPPRDRPWELGLLGRPKAHKQDLQPLIRRFQQGDQKAARELLPHLEPTVQQALGAFVGQSPSPVIQDRARLMALEALRGFDPKYKVEPSTHVYGQLRALRQVAPRISDPLPVPEQLRRDRGHVLRVAQTLRDQLDRDPTEHEVSDLADLPLQRVHRVFHMARRGIPLSAAMGEGGDDDQDFTPEGTVRTPEDDWLEAVDHDLGPVDRQILRWRTGHEGHEVLPNHEIAARLNLTPAAVSQRASKIQKLLEAWNG